ncbi:class I SAM-dependent methyltransferase [Peribacillus loiseleuriae]|uniref:SAM-dependent methyltransferase n=1 Tax=Peribacillus loiseleuriae TaxID=1679170 RepID=A0A0K9GTY7_9BACI|nr:rRNA adenine N-6-methyltransferase family protein [Peribacillus loiseleuriae]KMY50106.1 SAM-dependent methyltransferase [Peribacillus loiseleuriae]
MKPFNFIFQYMLNPREVGAVLPSSKYLAEKMVEGVDFHNAKYIVEFGPGTGVFTDKIIKSRIQHTVVMLIESNTEFCALLKEKYKDEKNLIIINGSVEDIDKYTKDFNIPYLDYVVSGLPFASLPKNVSSTILIKTKKLLRKNGVFITFQYTLIKKDFIHHYFKHIHLTREYRNMPPAYVFRCSN